ncbi:DUF349 domain-containing protein [Actinomyces sp. zg-332]|uniref:DUF349 domain-containing protein n=1 Tax=Actinomyces sp. zg-332 TaxID=2708340 RepID=UPI0014229172|nr:DUF349 domain-containing protein [Actinomyces sp. zg-332]QPK93659.1 DUF349 domain-containing protein [Actinomyces sp. zg-332]
MSDEVKANVSTPKVEASITEAEYAQYSKFGAIDDDGNVYVLQGDEKRLIGQFPIDVPERPFELYIRRYLDLKTQITIFSSRISNLSLKDLESPMKSIETLLENPAIIGDIDALHASVEALKAKVEARKEELKANRIAQREKTLAIRTSIVEKAEEIAHNCGQATNWKQSGQTLRDLLEEWKDSQRHGPRLDRKTENALWKRFSQARTIFDRQRRQFFAQLDQVQSQAKAIKEELVAKAESLASSTEWGKTTTAFRDLMEEWKKAPKANRKLDDELWERFRNAQVTFFDAKNEQNALLNEEFSKNLELKLALLERAESLLPITDLEVAKNSLRDILQEWDEIGRVPRSDVKKVQSRIRAVEDAVRRAEEEEWQRSNPETKVRAQGLAGLLQASIPELEEKIEKAKAKGDDAAVAKLTVELDSKKQWLEQALKTIEQ